MGKIEGRCSWYVYNHNEYRRSWRAKQRENIKSYIEQHRVDLATVLRKDIGDDFAERKTLLHLRQIVVDALPNARKSLPKRSAAHVASRFSVAWSAPKRVVLARSIKARCVV